MAETGRSRVDLVVIDDSSSEPVRQYLEYLDFDVRRIPVGRGQHLVDALSHPSDAVALVICGHGDTDGICLPELDPELAKSEPISGHLTPADVYECASLTRQMVVSTACCSGSQAFAKSFLAAGASSYIGPEGYPEATAALAFVTRLFYERSKGSSLRHAMRDAKFIDDETRTFEIYE